MKGMALHCRSGVLVKVNKSDSPQSRRERREKNFIRIPERRILIKVFAVFPLCPDGVIAPSGKGLIHSIFPLPCPVECEAYSSGVRGKYYQQNTQRSQRLKRAKRTGGKYYFLKVTFKKMELEFSIIHGSNPEVFP